MKPKTFVYLFISYTIKCEKMHSNLWLLYIAIAILLELIFFKSTSRDINSAEISQFLLFYFLNLPPLLSLFETVQKQPMLFTLNHFELSLIYLQIIHENLNLIG